MDCNKGEGAYEAYHCTVGNQTNQRIWWQKRQAHDKRVLESLKTVILLTSVDNVDKNGRSRSGSCQLVLDGGALRVEFWGYRVFGDILVVRREGIAHQTERADPNPRADIDSPGGA